MYNIVKVKWPYLRFRKGYEIFMPDHVVFALGVPEQMELLWGASEKNTDLYIYPCIGGKHNADLTNTLPEKVRRELGGHVIKARFSLELMDKQLKICADDVFIPGYYTAIGENSPYEGIAQMAAFKLNDATPWANQPEKEEIFITPMQEVSE